MRTSAFLVLFTLFCLDTVSGNGIIWDMSAEGRYLKLIQTEVNVNADQQVSVTKSTQCFINDFGDSLVIKYGFPLPEGASATQLKYKIDGQWYMASFSPVPQDTSTSSGGGGYDNTIVRYLGPNPLYYNIDQKIAPDSSIVVELTYVELLPYKFGKVKYTYPNDYSSIQLQEISHQSFSFSLNSERTIESIVLLSHSATIINNTGNMATIKYLSDETAANADYYLEFALSLDELGLFSLSTYIDDSLSKDDYGRGFFAFIVEPDPSDNTDVINKVFTLIVDRSGSMSGNKIVQARNAAQFIVENLNEGDKFNIVSFSSDITCFRPEHVDYNVSNKNAAIEYINTFTATGSTNISGAFNIAVPQFSYADNNTANIVIFFTDGEQTAGITNTDDLIIYIDDLISTSEKNISLFTFGIGSYTNERLLTAIANHNNGISLFLKDNELEDVITDFYMMVRNPVLLNTSVTFSPAVIAEVYPSQLPNLYKGQQMILIGRYDEPVPLTATIEGMAFGSQVVYNYSPVLSDSINLQYQFLTKLWAKAKIEDLLTDYYSNLDDQQMTESIKDEIIEISLDYGVMSPFTSFQGYDSGDSYSGTSNPTGITEWDLAERNLKQNEFIRLISVAPVPCDSYLKITYEITKFSDSNVQIRIVNSFGQTVLMDTQTIVGADIYEYEVNDLSGTLTEGIYILILEYQGEQIICKIIINQ